MKLKDRITPHEKLTMYPLFGDLFPPSECCGPAATSRPASPPVLSAYCACHAKSSHRSLRTAPATQRAATESPSTAPATQRAAADPRRPAVQRVRRCSLRTAPATQRAATESPSTAPATQRAPTELTPQCLLQVMDQTLQLLHLPRKERPQS